MRLLRPLLLCALLVLSLPALEQALLRRIEALPVQHEGRIKPLAAVARSWLLAVHQREALRLEGVDLSPSAWLLDLLSDPDSAWELPVFTERNPAVIEALGLEPDPRNAYSFRQLAHALNAAGGLLQAIDQRPPEEHDATERGLLRLADTVRAYYALSQSLTCLLPKLDIPVEVAARLQIQPGLHSPQDFLPLSGRLAILVDGIRSRSPDQLTADDRALIALDDSLRELAQHGGFELAIIPSHGDATWFSPWQLRGQGAFVDQEQVVAWQVFLVTWLLQDEAGLAGALDQLEAVYAGSIDRARLQLEVSYLHSNWFAWSKTLGILTLLLLGGTMLTGSPRWRQLAHLGLISACLASALGIGLRIWLLQRPPVATLYESIIFVATIAMLASLTWEFLRRDGLALITGAAIGVMLHFVADGYAAEGDTLGMLQAVLNSRFWLTTHVLTIAIGYGCALVCGAVGHCYLGLAILRPGDVGRLRSIERAMLGLSLVALFFTLVGTILGGIWADQSWGRFWGWDPKENGALWIVLWLLMLLHLRLADQLPPLLFAAGLVLLNVVVSLAWFGVNLLGVGMHSYGFDDSKAVMLLVFCLGEGLLALLLGLAARARLSSSANQPQA
jgi:ABC-type transport system involved in cytochrome c biogenesis permease subunit